MVGSGGRSRPDCRAVELRDAGCVTCASGEWRADEDQANVVTVENVTRVFQGSSVETLRFIDDDQFHIFPGQYAFRFTPMLVDADVDAHEHFV